MLLNSRLYEIILHAFFCYCNNIIRSKITITYIFYSITSPRTSLGVFCTGASGMELPHFNFYIYIFIANKHSLLIHLLFLYLTFSCPYISNIVVTTAYMYWSWIIRGLAHVSCCCLYILWICSTLPLL